MNLLIVGGFLGSGKTTLIGQLARYLTSRKESEHEVRAVIIENEIGNVSIDQQALSTRDLEVKNIYAGCVCCTLRGEVGDTLNALKKEMNPEWVILELSGVAVPVNVKEVADQLKIPAKICVLIDADRWERISGPLHQLITSQLEETDFILINKSENKDEEYLNVIEASLEVKYANTFRTSLELENLPLSFLREMFNEN